MRNMIKATICLLVFTLTVHGSYAQQDSLPKRHKIALFVPLYLDSAFEVNSTEYKQGKQFPKYFNPGLEFYEGAQLALDSLKKEGIPLEVSVYDTRSGKSLYQVSEEQAFTGTELIISYLSSPNEVKAMAGIAQEKKIPFINANLPNDGNVSSNPFMVILNATLRTHCQGIYQFLQKNYMTARLVVFQKKGGLENVLKSYFSEIEKNTSSVPLKLKFITLENNFTPQQLTTYLDSTEQTICIGASLDETFARSLSQQLAYLNDQYPSELIGMPTWDAIAFEKKEYAGLNIYYSTPFYHEKTDKASLIINNYFKTVLYSRPSDMVFRGYECFYRFGKLLAEQGPNLPGSLGEKKYKVFHDFDIQPVFLNGASQNIDYFENKKLYFLKKLNGEIKGVY